MLELPCIDSGGGWLIFKLPPAELGVHGHDANDFHQIYFICDDVDASIAKLAEKGVTCARSAGALGPDHRRPLPGGGKLGLYEATHARP